MEEHQQFKDQVRSIYKLFTIVFMFVGVLAVMMIYLISDPSFSAFKKSVPVEYVSVQEEVDDDKIENGIHLRTGLVEADGLMEVVYNCTNCHSAKIIIQNRMNTERWKATILWMQQTQNLADLGNNEDIIINYLVTNYPPLAKGRRQILTNIEWYELKN